MLNPPQRSSAVLDYSSDKIASLPIREQCDRVVELFDKRRLTASEKEEVMHLPPLARCAERWDYEIAVRNDLECIMRAEGTE
jgi:hypothetical protein